VFFLLRLFARNCGFDFDASVRQRVCFGTRVGVWVSTPRNSSHRPVRGMSADTSVEQPFRASPMNSINSEAPQDLRQSLGRSLGGPHAARFHGVHIALPVGSQSSWLATYIKELVSDTALFMILFRTLCCGQSNPSLKCDVDSSSVCTLSCCASSLIAATARQ